MKKAESPQKPRLPVALLVVSGVILAILVALVVVFWHPLLELMQNTDRIREYVSDAGVFGPLVFIVIQFLQILIAPIPGQVIGVASGALFGVWLGSLYSIIGSLIGMIVVISLARRLGRPFVERFVNQNVLKKFDYLINNNGPIVFFFIMLLPIFPDDLICYLVGLSRIPIRTLVIVGILGRIPTTIGSALIGAGVADINMPLTIGAIVVVVAIGAVGYWQRVRLEAWVRRIAKRSNKK